MLLLDENEIKLPNIECLFTTEEEIGMNGARSFNYSDIEAKYLINLDGEEENTAIVGCAGGVTTEYTKEVNISECKDKKVYTLEINGLYGGHSGVDIDKGRMNSNYLAANLLDDIKDIEIISWKGGTKDNAIANSTSVIFASSNDSFKDLIDNKVESLDVTEEDLKYMRDLAERDVINRFTTAEIKIDMTNNNNINSEQDLDGIINTLSEGLYETMTIAAEGVHE